MLYDVDDVRICADGSDDITFCENICVHWANISKLDAYMKCDDDDDDNWMMWVWVCVGEWKKGGKIASYWEIIICRDHFMYEICFSSKTSDLQIAIMMMLMW